VAIVTITGEFEGPQDQSTGGWHSVVTALRHQLDELVQMDKASIANSEMYSN
jgi:hypothetical protein